ncbi:hypothetical protein G5714_021594 [Onychostoma macrolepis]|uniref:Uncharacterized protein n=1 Tax=Onychostoma macrolepis TaxID=369639 RepID=A0A7J6BRK2_9TELE|nr:hypothetical protein G5714_021594 [Onychostoma macrolepis]
MAAVAQLASTIRGGLSKSVFFCTFPANLLLIPLEILADHKFSCPCDSQMNTPLTGLIFSAPAIFLLALMLLYYWHVKYVKKEKQKTPINLLLGTFPPILWIILLLIDGEYVACSKTDWKGEYVFDDKLKIKWCKPTEMIPGRNETTLQKQTLGYINHSQRDGFIVLLSYSVLIIVVVSFTCCLNAKEPEELSQEEDHL